MLDFSVDADTEMVLDTARRFARDVLLPEQRSHEEARGMPAALLQQARDIGFDTLNWPETLGGAGLGWGARVAVLEALGQGDAAAVLAIDAIGPVFHALHAAGGDAAIEQYVQPLLRSAGSRAVLVFDEHEQLSLKAGTLSGVVPWVPADRVDLLVVLTRSRILVLGQGVALQPLPGSGLRAAGASELRLQNVPVLAQFDQPEAASAALAQARLYVAALMVGQMHTAAEYSREYALQRVAFGKPIAHHQALSFLIVDMRTAVDAARLMVQEAAFRADAGQPCQTAAAQAFLEAAQAAMFVGPNAVQILGASGFTRDYPVEKYMRELRALALLLGGVDAARDDLNADNTLVDAPVSFLIAEPGAQA